MGKKKRKRRKRKVNPNFPFLLKEQELHSKLIRWLTNLGLNIEGRMFVYLNEKWKNKSKVFGCEEGLPQIEIHNQRGSFVKCGIWLKPLSLKDKKIVNVLKKCRWLCLNFTNVYPLEIIKKIVLKKYINLRNRKRKRNENSLPTTTTTTNLPPLKKRKKVKVRNYKKEKDFHKDVIKLLKNYQKNEKEDLIFEGRIQGNIGNKKVGAFSNKMGYMIDSADITIKNPSFDNKYTHLDLELKIGNKKPRETQKEKLLFLSNSFNHFPAYLNTTDGKKEALKSTKKIVQVYLNGPEDELIKYRV